MLFSQRLSLHLRLAEHYEEEVKRAAGDFDNLTHLAHHYSLALEYGGNAAPVTGGGVGVGGSDGGDSGGAVVARRRQRPARSRRRSQTTASSDDSSR